MLCLPCESSSSTAPALAAEPQDVPAPAPSQNTRVFRNQFPNAKRNSWEIFAGAPWNYDVQQRRTFKDRVLQSVSVASASKDFSWTKKDRQAFCEVLLAQLQEDAFRRRYRERSAGLDTPEEQNKLFMLICNELQQSSIHDLMEEQGHTVDWMLVSVKVNAALKNGPMFFPSQNYNAANCYIHYLHDVQKGIARDEFTEAENAALKCAVQRIGAFDWETIAKHVSIVRTDGNARDAWQCFARYQRQLSSSLEQQWERSHQAPEEETTSTNDAVGSVCATYAPASPSVTPLASSKASKDATTPLKEAPVGEWKVAAMQDKGDMFDVQPMLLSDGHFHIDDMIPEPHVKYGRRSSTTKPHSENTNRFDGNTSSPNTEMIDTAVSPEEGPEEGAISGERVRQWSRKPRRINIGWRLPRKPRRTKAKVGHAKSNGPRTGHDRGLSKKLRRGLSSSPSQNEKASTKKTVALALEEDPEGFSTKDSDGDMPPEAKTQQTIATLHIHSPKLEVADPCVSDRYCICCGKAPYSLIDAFCAACGSRLDDMPMETQD